MINWDLLSPRNLCCIVVMVLAAIAIFNFFSQTHKTDGDN